MAGEPSIDVDRLIASGVYDPASPRAADRLELVTYLFEHGSSQDQIEETFAAQGLNGLIEQLQAAPEGSPRGSIVDVLISRDRLSAIEIAARAGVPVDLVMRVRAELGFRDDDPDARVIPGPFVDDVVGVAFGAALFGEEAILGLVRVVGSTAIRLAEASRAVVFTDLAANLMDTPGGELAMLRTNQQATGALPLIPAAFTRAFFEHVNRLADVMVPTDPQRLDIASLDVAVAFVDLVASTAWTEQATRGELRGALNEFERLANTLATEHGCRLVKTNGDDAMFVGF
ncbi:MAG TPA: adenylate cyclase regulatory domain-containing protein, partial [Acidimicrobiales bacterium]|nr:adenylate cyclase regulatory domain-containing protein [Acidimicrobiales bacterium]